MQWQCLTLVVLSAIVNTSVSADPLYETDIHPIFKRHCAGCHFPEAERLKSGLDLSTAALALEGGNEAVSIIPGDATSPLIAMLEWTHEPHMPPPDKGEQLSPEEIDTIRRWIATGAKSNPALAPPAEEPPAPITADELARAPIASLAYSPDGNYLAEGTLGTVRIHSTASKDKSPVTLTGHNGTVRAIAFTHDGQTLAAGAGAPGRSGEVHLWNTADWTLTRTLNGHRDHILDLAISPDDKILATTSYDKTARLWNLTTGELLHTLKDHVDAVYTTAFSPDGTLLATGAGDRTIKLWNVDTGRMTLTISDSLAAVHTLAFSPATGFLAGAGADKLIRIWQVAKLDENFTQTDHGPGTLIASSFAHDAPVLKLAFSPDGTRIYSTAQDRQLKAWNADNLTELLTFEPQSDWVTGLALSPDGKHLAAARYDATRAVYETETGAPVVAAATTPARSLDVDSVIIEATVPPSLQSVSPGRTHRGAELELALAGKNLADAELALTRPGITAEIIEVTALDPPDLSPEGRKGTGAQILDNARPYRIKVKLAIAEDAPLGNHEILLRTPIGMSNGRNIQIVPRPDLREADIKQDVAVQWPAVIAGRIEPAESEHYKVRLDRGHEFVAALTDTTLNPIMTLRNNEGTIVATNNDHGKNHRTKLAHTAQAAGDYTLEIKDRDQNRRANYRLHIGAFPFVTALWPPGIQTGQPGEIAITGFNLSANQIQINPPGETTHDTTIPLPIKNLIDNPIPLPRIAVADRPESLEREPNNDTPAAQPLPVPATVNGKIESPSDRDLYRFTANAGETLILEVNAARLGSELDAFIQLLDTNGAPLQRGVIRPVAQTIITLNNRDSRTAGIRLDSWRDFKMGDHLMIGSEIIKIENLPDYGDEDVAFAAYPNGQRIGYYGTTPEHHAVNTKVYKVEIHPPDATFAPNGMPAQPLYWQNDDGFFHDGQANGDSLLEFTPPYTGEFILAITDTTRNGSPRHPYRLAIRRPQPDFTLDRSPFRLNVSRNSRVPLDVRVRRIDNFDAPVKVWIENLPEGFTANPDTILPGEDRVKLAITAGPNAESTPLDARFTIKSESMLNGKTVQRETSLGPITIVQPDPDLVVYSAVDALTVLPGKSDWLAIALDRNNGFNARVPIDVLNLPYGVRVLDTGLNGILVRAGERDRRMEFYAEPWVKPMTRTIYVQARIETPSARNPVFIGKAITLHIGRTGEADDGSLSDDD